ncbi:hypothetical protein CEXT_736361 [Caerostris extrusa]|uniref:Uncharacterized protein n=1 Tax=Caerostris extrusa TaxID=172846 RepID=A0AAV4NI01_CAEEX|nr:hypothetical protein CEXT_736361 [Caerostris extrusa]
MAERHAPLFRVLQFGHAVNEQRERQKKNSVRWCVTSVYLLQARMNRGLRNDQRGEGLHLPNSTYNCFLFFNRAIYVSAYEPFSPPVTSVARFRKGNTVCRGFLKTRSCAERGGFSIPERIKMRPCLPTCGTPTLRMRPRDNGHLMTAKGGVAHREGGSSPRLGKFSSALSRSSGQLKLK